MEIRKGKKDKIQNVNVGNQTIVEMCKFLKLLKMYSPKNIAVQLPHSMSNRTDPSHPVAIFKY